MAKDEWDLPEERTGKSKLDSSDNAFDDINFDIDPGKDNRSPVTKFRSGVVDELLSIEAGAKFVKRTAYESLPNDYKEGLKKIKDIKREASDVYDTTLKRAAPGIKNLKKVGRRVIPGLEKILPKSVTERLKGLTAEDSQQSVNYEELEIAATLTSIFDAQQKANQITQKENELKESTQTEIAKKQFSATMESSARIADGISRLVGYQDNVLSKFQRKSLELQHRHYFAAKELLAVTKTTNAAMIEQLADITKNTGLPNEAKAQLNEKWWNANKERLIGIVQDTAYSRLMKLPKKMVQGMQEKLFEMAEGFNMAMEGLDQVSEMADGEFMSPASMLGKMVGESLRNKVSDKVINSKYVKGLMNRDGVKKGGSAIQYLIESFPRILNEQIKKGEGFQGNKLQQFLYEISGGGVYDDKLKVERRLAKDIITPASWDVLSRRTLVEIIPGYLAKILKEVHIGNIHAIPPGKLKQLSKMSEITFSVEQEKFITKAERVKEIHQRISREMASSGLAYGNQQTMQDLLGKTKVAPEIQQEISRLMMQSAQRGEVFDPRRFTELTDKDTPYYKEINKYFKKRFATHLIPEGMSASNIFSEFGTSIQSPEITPAMMERYKNMAKGYNRYSHYKPNVQRAMQGLSVEELHASGLIDEETGQFHKTLLDRINLAALQGEEDFTNVKGHAEGGEIDKKKKTKINPKDTVPTMLQEGEFVVTKAAVDKYGVEFLESLNNVNDKKSRRKRTTDTSKSSNMMLSHAEQQTMLLARIARAVESGYTINSDGTVNQYGYFGKLPSDISKGVKSGFRTLRRAVTRGNSLRSDLWDGFIEKVAKPTTKFAIDKGGKLVDWSKKKFEQGKEMATDLYIKGESRVALSYSKLKANHYYYINDKNEKVFLKSWKDIKESTYDIYDSTTNTVAITKDQITKLHSLNIDKVKGFFSTLKDRGTTLLNKQFDILTSGMDVLKDMGRTVYRKLTAPVDVYVQGKIEEGPRLRSIIFINGGYKDAQWNTIDHHDKINGPVYTVTKTGKLRQALTHEDIMEGLCELDGTPITGKGLFGKYVDKAIKLGKTGWNLAKKAGRTALDVLGNIGSAIRGKLPKGGIRIGVNYGIETRLDKILRHLQHAFPVPELIDEVVTTIGIEKVKRVAKEKIKKIKSINKQSIKDSLGSMKDRIKDKWSKFRDKDGDGILSGSWEEIQAKRKAAKANFVGPPKPDESGKLLKGLKGIIGGIASAIGSFANLVGGILKMIPGLGKLLPAVSAVGGVAWGATKLLGKGLLGGLKLSAKTPGAMLKFGRGAAMVGRVGLGLATGPVGWTALAATVIGYMAWSGYQYYKRRKNLDPLEKLRFLQYGVPIVGTPVKNAYDLVTQPIKEFFGKEDARVAIHYLEEELVDMIKLKENGGFSTPTFEEIWTKFHRDFDCEADNVIHQQSFRRWFYERFLPVYVWHSRAALKYGKCPVKIADEKVPIKEKAAYVKLVQFGPLEMDKLNLNPYGILSSPWPNTTIYGNKEYIKMLSEGIIEASNAGVNLDARASSVIDKKQANTIKAGDPSKIVREPTFRGFLKDTVLRTLGKTEQADKELVKGQYQKNVPTKNNVLPGSSSETNIVPYTVNPEKDLEKISLSKDPKILQDYIMKAAKSAGMKDDELAIFMANAHHETAGFRYMSANLNYKAEGLMKTFPKLFKDINFAKSIVAQGPEGIANYIYKGVNGNTQPGDGFKFRERGFLQLTGRENYAKAGKALGIDLINNPDLASQPDIAAQIALWFWSSSGAKKAVTEAGSYQEKLTAARTRINGKRMLGLADTNKLAAIYKFAEDKQAVSSIPKASINPATTNKGAYPFGNADRVSKATSPMATSPNINVAAPDLSPINQTYAQYGDSASQERQQQLQLLQEQNNILLDLKNTVANAKTPGSVSQGSSAKRVDSVIDLSRKV